jgi:hypothetical protein
MQLMMEFGILYGLLIGIAIAGPAGWAIGRWPKRRKPTIGPGSLFARGPRQCGWEGCRLNASPRSRYCEVHRP